MNNRILMTLAFAIVHGLLWALPYTVGDCTIDVEIRSRAMIPILHRWVSVREKNGAILVLARADGYVTRRVEIPKAAGQTQYKVDLVLDDEPRRILVRDIAGAPIASAYVDASQFGFPSDVFGFKVYVPCKVMPHPDTTSIAVMGDMVWVPFPNTWEVETIEGFQKISITIDRKAYGATQRLLSVVIAVDKTAEDDPGDNGAVIEDAVGHDTMGMWLDRLLEVERGERTRKDVPRGSAMAMARFLAQGYPEALLVSSMETMNTRSSALTELLEQRKTFRSLHRD